MKKIAFISGKGGTGKSTLVSSISEIARDRIIADCDVDAPDLHLLLSGKKIRQEDFYGAKEAVINEEMCIKCGLCVSVCEFDAISEDISIMPYKCEGCGACVLVCPNKAIKLKSIKTGITTISETDGGIFSHALLDVGAEGSGRLVTKLRQNAEAFSSGEKFMLIDGSPGIGCVVIASITGTDAVVAVTEPTLSGLSDLKRVLEVAGHFGIKSFVCINKYDLNRDITRQIEEFCRERDIEIIGKIPFNKEIVRALQEYKTPVRAEIKGVAEEIKNIWNRILVYFENKKKEN